MAKDNRKALIIAGYYRSGTSALSGSLARLGVTIHDETDANEHNPLGFYEIPELISLDVEIMTSLGIDWSDLLGPQPGWAERADMAVFANRIFDICQARFSSADFWALKHPHLCRLLPLYAQAIRRTGSDVSILHIYRDPYIVADSQRKKNNLSRVHALLLWCSYLIDAERNGRGMPRGWLSYNDLLQNPKVALGRALEAAEIRFPATDFSGVDTFLRKKLNRSIEAPREGVYPPLARLVDEVWDLACTPYSAASPPLWDALGARVTELADLIIEMGRTQSRAAIGVGTAAGAFAAPAMPPALGTGTHIGHGLRPAERTDDAAKARLLRRLGTVAKPSITIIVACPSGQLGGLPVTMRSLAAQWAAPEQVHIVSMEEPPASDMPVTMLHRATDSKDFQAKLAELMQLAKTDYVAFLNAADMIEPDAVARLSLAAAATHPDMLYTDEVVARPGAPWIRFKPAWDIERLRRSVYIGDWVWYRLSPASGIYGLDASLEGAEEYELQFRLFERGAKAERFPEALYVRAPGSRRDDVPVEVAFGNAAKVIAAHLLRCGIEAEVAAGTVLGTFAVTPAPGHAEEAVAIVIDCQGAALDHVNSMAAKVFEAAYPDDILIFVRPAPGTMLETAPLNGYLNQIAASAADLGSRVLVLPYQPSPGHLVAAVLAATMADRFLFTSALAVPARTDWLTILRRTLALPEIDILGCKIVAQQPGRPNQLFLTGPLIPGAGARLGAGRAADDLGPGAWLGVEQHADAVTPPGLMARRSCLVALGGQNLPTWGQVCLAAGRAGRTILWTPSVIFLKLEAEAESDPEVAELQNVTHQARHHHPALSLTGDTLSPSSRSGLVPDYPADTFSNLISGPPMPGSLDAVRVVRALGAAQISWSPEPVTAGEINRMSSHIKRIRLNPEHQAEPGHPAWTGIWNALPSPAAHAAVKEANAAYGTSPAVVTALRGMGAKARLWLPTISRDIWQPYRPMTGLNTKIRVLWCDEGLAPPWFIDLVNRTLNSLAWIVVEQPGASYSGSITRLARPQSEAQWAANLAQLSPQIMVRPTGSVTWPDRFLSLTGAAAGCTLYLSEALHLDAAVPALRLPDKPAAWDRAINRAASDLSEVLESGQASRAAVLGGGFWTEDDPPPWCAFDDRPIKASQERDAA
jgi:hypothetical protein